MQSFRRRFNGSEIHTSLCRSFAHLLRAHCRRETFGHVVDGIRVRHLVFFHHLILFPNGKRAFTVRCFVFTKYMGMACDEFLAHARQNVREVKCPHFLTHNRVENYLQRKVARFFQDLFIIVKIDGRLIEAAEDLGCTPVQVFSKVVLPLSMPGILSGITMVFVPAVSTFYISQKLGGAETMLIGDVIEKQFKTSNNPNLGAALSLLLMLMVLVCTGIMNRFGGNDEEGGVVV